MIIFLAAFAFGNLNTAFGRGERKEEALILL
jgi:hypothetical protein